MKRLIGAIVLVALFVPVISAFKMKSFDNGVEAGIGYAISAAINLPVYEGQCVYNATNNFYIGGRLTYIPMLYNDSATLSDTVYNDAITNIAVILGARTSAIDERYSLFINLLPSFSFVSRQKLNSGNASYPMRNETGEIHSVLETTSSSFFSPSVEVGVSANLTDNLVLSTAFSVMFTEATDLRQVVKLWYIPLGPSAWALNYIPARLSWRF